MNRFTQNLMANFPSWMKMAKDPDSVGAQFLDVFGLTFAEFEQELDETIANFYIQTANTELIDWLYKIPLNSVTVADEQFDAVFLRQENGAAEYVLEAPNLRVFYHRDTQVPAYWIDRSGGYLYLRVNLDTIEDWDQPFQSLEINGAPHYDLSLHPVWNAFDEFGLLLGLRRLPRERNAAFKARILSIFQQPSSVTQAGVQAGIARELGLLPEEVEVRSLADEDFQQELLLPNGTPSQRLMRYAKQVNETLKFSWDTMNFGEAYWFSVEQDNIAIHYLPHVWDADLSAFKKTDFQSGVGGGDDLLVHKPKKEESFRPVTVSIGLMGYVSSYEEIHPEITFTYKIYAEGKVVERDYQEQPFKYTVRAAEVFEQDFRIRADADLAHESTLDLSGPQALTNGTDAPAWQFGKSTDFLHTQTDALLRLSVQLRKLPGGGTPRLQDLGVVWEDTTGQEHTFPFENESHHLIDRTNKSGNPMTNVVYSDIAYEGGLNLGYGAFHDTVDTTEEWREGEWDVNNLLVSNGSLRLNLNQFNPGLNGPSY